MAQEGEDPRLFLNLEKLKAEVNLVLRSRQQVQEIASQHRAAVDGMAAAFSAITSKSPDFRLRATDLNLPRLDAMAAAKISFGASRFSTLTIPLAWHVLLRRGAQDRKSGFSGGTRIERTYNYAQAGEQAQR